MVSGVGVPSFCYILRAHTSLKHHKPNKKEDLAHSMQTLQKKDIHNREKQFNNARIKLEMDEVIIKKNRDFILRFIRDCRLGKTLKNRQKKSIGVARCLKYIQILRQVSEWLNKPFNVVSQSDMEKMIENLENDHYKYQYLKKDGRVSKTCNYAHSTKLDYKKTIRKFYKWLLGNNKHYPELVDWIDTYDIVKEIPAISREDVEKLAESSNIRDKAIIMFLYDSGARIEEALNIRIKDLTKTEDTYKVRITVSKTKPRTIHLPICSKFLELWLNEYQDKTEVSYLFPVSYEGLRGMLHRRSKVLLNKSVTPHLLRHSSATYYANHLSHFQLCYRYGWSMASKMPNRYLDREGIFEQETTKTIQNNDISNLEKQNQLLKEEISYLKESNQELSLEFNQLKEKLDGILQGRDFIQQLMKLS